MSMPTQAFQASQVFPCSEAINTTRLLFHHLRRANTMTTQGPDPPGELFCSKNERKESELIKSSQPPKRTRSCAIFLNASTTSVPKLPSTNEVCLIFPFLFFMHFIYYLPHYSPPFFFASQTNGRLTITSQQSRPIPNHNPQFASSQGPFAPPRRTQPLQAPPEFRHRSESRPSPLAPKGHKRHQGPYEHVHRKIQGAQGAGPQNGQKLHAMQTMYVGGW
jgi:hypothetical protein